MALFDSHPPTHVPVTRHQVDYGLGGDGSKEDASDPFFDEGDPDDPKVFAAFRGYKYGSHWVIAAVQRFGAAGGFDAVLKRLGVIKGATQPSVCVWWACVSGPWLTRRLDFARCKNSRH